MTISTSAYHFQKWYFSTFSLDSGTLHRIHSQLLLYWYVWNIKGQMKSQTFPTFNFTDETMMIMIHFGWKKKIIIRKYGIFLILGTWEFFSFTCSGFFDQKRFLGKLIYPRSSTAYSICFKYGPLALIHECETNNY